MDWIDTRRVQRQSAFSLGLITIHDMQCVLLSSHIPSWLMPLTYILHNIGLTSDYLAVSEKSPLQEEDFTSARVISYAEYIRVVCISETFKEE